MISWVISNKNNIKTDLKQILSNKHSRFSLFYCDDSKYFYDKNEIFIIIDGYVLPRKNYYYQYSNLNQFELVYKLYLNYNKDFINYVKGVFNIIILDNGNFCVFNDRHSIKKFFIYRKDLEYIISNKLKIIAENVNLEFNEEYTALFCLMEHFIDGLTLYNNLKYSKPATIVNINNREIEISHYWKSEELLNLKQKEYNFNELADSWKTLINQYIDYLKPKDITMTLTGGNDSRMILAALLNSGIKPNAFTFGNPKSFDGVVAQKIAETVNINYNNYFISQPSTNWFSNKADEIINIGNSLINIHRAHRLEAIESEIPKNPNVQMIFGGFMGGDYVKGVTYDDYITAKIVRLWEYSKLEKKQIIKLLLKEKYFYLEKINIERVISLLLTQKFIDKPKKIQREFHFVADVVGSIHDVQDINIFNTKISYPVNPFMDIDFLYLLFSSKYSMLNNDNSSKNPFKILKIPKFHINITNILAPEISYIEYSKKGYYTANEFLGNKLIYILKRVYRLKQYKSYPPNFPYGLWVKQYIIKELNYLHPILENIINVNKMKKNLSEDLHHYKEGYWHQFTSIININKNLKYYI